MHFNLIDGERVGSKDVTPDINPSDTDDVIGEYARADAEDVKNAIAAAKVAFPAWSRSGIWERHVILNKAADEIMVRKNELGALLAREEGRALPRGDRRARHQTEQGVHRNVLIMTKTTQGRSSGMKLNVFFAALAMFAVVTDAIAAETHPAILYDMGGKFDKSFNENAFNGMDKFRRETGAKVLEFEINREAEREQALRTYARQGGNPIVVVGFAWSVPLKKIASQFPETRFIIIDSVVDEPNVQSIEFAYNEGAFLVGALAALKSKSGTIGFVGGMDIPIIRNFECGYESGARYAKPEIRVIQNMTGTTPAAWTDPARARELALSQFDQGADVVFGAAGGSTMGVLQAAADARKLAIGVGTNQNGLHPGSILTSATAYIDNAVYSSLKDAEAGKWEAGTKVLGVKQQGVGWSLDENNKSLLSEDDIKAVTQIETDIGSGKITVPNFLKSNACK